MPFKIPDSIWLQYYGEDWLEDDEGNLEKPDYDTLPEIGDVTWQDERIFNSDIEFIRKDIANRRIAELEEHIDKIEAQLRFTPVEEQPPDKEGEYIAICEMIGSKIPFRVIVFWDNALGWCFPFIGWRKNTIVTHYLRIPKREAKDEQ